MGFYFRNLTNETVYIAFAYPNPNCPGSKFQKVGWYVAGPGQRVTVLTGYVGNSVFYWYAESNTLEWRGVYTTRVPETRFNYCWDTNVPSWRVVGMQPEYTSITTYNYTVFLYGSSSSKTKSKSGNVNTVSPAKLKKGKSNSGKKPMALPSLPMKKRELKPRYTVLTTTNNHRRLRYKGRFN